MLDYDRGAGNVDFTRLLQARTRDYFLKDTACPIAYEPSGEDFLSPCLAEADAMRRILPPAEFARWFTAFLPRVDLEPTYVTDFTDGKLYHLAGLNLSRAWMLEGIVAGLPAEDARRKPLTALAGRFREAGLQSIRSEHYEGGHWLGSYALYLVSGRASYFRQRCSEPRDSGCRTCTALAVFTGRSVLWKAMQRLSQGRPQ
jgi:hypothetical protein